MIFKCQWSVVSWQWSILNFAFCILHFTFFSSCVPDYVPKPRGYFRIDVPEKKYSRFVPPVCPFSFEIPQYAKVDFDTNRFAEPCWMSVKFPRFRGELFLSYKPLHNNLNQYAEDAHTLAYKHSVKADVINESRIVTPNTVYGVFYEIGGNAASSVQFFATDSTKNYLRGALYFNAPPNNDSIAPVLKFIKDDIMHMINSLEWK